MQSMPLARHDEGDQRHRQKPPRRENEILLD
jgi:hypothetical protein